MPTYPVLDSLDAGKRYAPGSEIDLDEADAAPLIALGVLGPTLEAPEPPDETGGIGQPAAIDKADAAPESTGAAPIPTASEEGGKPDPAQAGDVQDPAAGITADADPAAEPAKPEKPAKPRK